ncbi:zinc-binding dehydrogenase [Pseudomonas aeruginosa]|nr:zinc-binding dehydrogenase [Pseudomonas aeruginosa]
MRGRPVPRAAATLSLGAGHDRHDRLLRVVARRRPAEERRDRGDLRRRRCGGQRCRADRQAQGAAGWWASPAAPRNVASSAEELGFDGAIDYKNEDLAAGLKRECPKGIDVFFDNVGGEILDTVLTRIAFRHASSSAGRSASTTTRKRCSGPANYLSLLVNRARMEGMVVMDYAQRFPEGLKEMATWLAEGKLQSREDIVEGLRPSPKRCSSCSAGKTSASWC